MSSLIVQREVATMRQVEEALAHQVVYGGDLVTNLLEVAPVDEKALTELIAEAMHLAPAPSGELPVVPERAQMVPADMAITCGIVPLRLDGEVLVLAVAEPIPPDLEERLMFSLGLAIDQRAASPVRVRQAIARLYGVPLESRMLRLVAKLSGAPSSASVTGAPSPVSVAAAPSPASAGMATPPLGSPMAGRSERGEQSGGNATPYRSMTPPPPARHQTAGGFRAASVPVWDSHSWPRPDRLVPDSIPPSTPVTPERRVGLLQRDVPSGPRSARRRRGPITLETATREADTATDRDMLLDLFFDFSRQFFDYAALFLVHGDIAEGRDAFGMGASRERVAGIGVPLDLPSLMSRARDEHTVIVASVPSDGLDAVLLTDLQRPSDAEIAIVPLIVRTRAVAILIGDCGDAQIDDENVQQVTAFGTVVGKALERVIVRRKLQGFVAGGKAGDPGRGDSFPVAGPSTLPPTPTERGSARPVSFGSTSTMPPPPANVATVRKFSGPPIPREEPDSAKRPESPPSPVPPVLKVIDDKPIGERVPEDLDARALFDILGWETGAEEPEGPPPSSAIALPPHLPPHGHIVPSEELPSVIVDLDQELAAIVDRVIRGEADESAEGELLRQGERAMRVIMARFPGPVNFERERITSMANPPRASECGPLLRLVVRERKVALPFVLERLSDPDPDTRGWATHLLCELPYDEAIPHLLGRLRDPDPCTRASAMQAIAAVAKVYPDQARDAIKAHASAQDPTARTAAMLAMGCLRQAGLVPDLIGALADGDERVVVAAHEALVLAVLQDFGSDARPWLKWWEQNASRHRIEWLIDALTHDVSEIRRGAGEELRAITRQYFGYSGDLPPRDRDRAQQRYRDWWITEGRTRFRRR